MLKVTSKRGVDGKGYHSVDFKPEVKMNIAPVIVGEYEEDGNRWYALANGNTSLADTYDKWWNPAKGKVHSNKFYKGLNPDKTKII